MNDLFSLASLGFLVAFSVFGLVDGMYLHLIKFRLFARAEARREHAIHSLRAVLFVPALLLVFVGTTSGTLLWIGILAIAIDFVIQILDTREEADSRSFTGGLPNYELAIHVVAAMAHLGLIVTSLLARPHAAFAETVVIESETAIWVGDAVINVFLGGSVLMAALHVALMHPRVATWANAKLDRIAPMWREAPSTR